MSKRQIPTIHIFYVAKFKMFATKISFIYSRFLFANIVSPNWCKHTF